MTNPNFEHERRPPTELVPPHWTYPSANFQREDEISILDYWRVFKRRKWQIFLVTFIAGALAFGFSSIMPKKYRAEVTLMPITSSGGGGMAGVAAQISAMPLVGGALGDISKLGGGKTKELVNILKSRTLTESIINQFDLLKVIFAKQYDAKSNTFFPKFMKPVPVLEDGVEAFRKRYSKVEEEKKTGLVKINVTMKDPELAARIANQMVVELQNFILKNTLTISKRNRIFLEEQLVKTKVKLLEAGKELNQFYAENKISSVVPQLDVNVGSYQTSPRPYEEFLSEFDKISREQKEAELKKQFFVNRVPGQVYLQFLNLNRELLSRTFALLTQQYELAKIEEAKEDLAFQVIDKAQVKVRASSPKVLLNVAIALVGGFFLALFLAFFRDYLEAEKRKGN